MNNDIFHWGIFGQKWGVRRYQNPDGSLTEEGKRRYYGSGGKGRTSNSMNAYLARSWTNADAVPITSMLTNVVAPSARLVSRTMKEAEVKRQQKAFNRVVKEAMKNMDDAELKSKLGRVTAENNYIKQMNARYHTTKNNAVIGTADALEAIATITPIANTAYSLWSGQAEAALQSAMMAEAYASTSTFDTPNSVDVGGGSVSVDINDSDLRSHIAN